jgi:membrane protein required for colicin V production
MDFEMNRFDMIVLVIICLYGLRGMIRGIWSELFELIIVLVSIVVSVSWVESFAVWLSGIIHIPLSLATLIAFFVLYMLISFLLRIVVRFLYERKKVPFFHRIWGGGIGILRGLLAAGIFAFLVSNYLSIQKRHWEKEKSLLVKPIAAVAPATYQALMTLLPGSKAVFEQMSDGFVFCADRVRDRITPSSVIDK